MKLKEIHQQLRPREKAMKYGIHTLTDIELLALILRTGTKGKSVLELAEEVYNVLKNFGYLLNLNKVDFTQIKGISKVKLLELKGIGEIAKRITFEQIKDTNAISNPEKLANWVNQEIGFKKQEHFMVIFLDTKNTIIDYKILFIGTLDASLVHPREVFKEAFQLSASCIILAHNHPSGNVGYSEADKKITKQLIEVGILCGIPVLDHIIVGGNDMFSFREHNILKF